MESSLEVPQARATPQPEQIQPAPPPPTAAADAESCDARRLLAGRARCGRGSRSDRRCRRPRAPPAIEPPPPPPELPPVPPTRTAAASSGKGGRKAACAGRHAGRRDQVRRRLDQPDRQGSANPRNGRAALSGEPGEGSHRRLCRRRKRRGRAAEQLPDRSRPRPSGRCRSDQGGDTLRQDPGRGGAGRARIPAKAAPRCCSNTDRAAAIAARISSLRHRASSLRCGGFAALTLESYRKIDARALQRVGRARTIAAALASRTPHSGRRRETAVEDRRRRSRHRWVPASCSCWTGRPSCWLSAPAAGSSSPRSRPAIAAAIAASICRRCAGTRTRRRWRPIPRSTSSSS